MKKLKHVKKMLESKVFEQGGCILWVEIIDGVHTVHLDHAPLTTHHALQMQKHLNLYMDDFYKAVMKKNDL